VEEVRRGLDKLDRPGRQLDRPGRQLDRAGHQLDRPGHRRVSKVGVGLLLAALTASCTSEPSGSDEKGRPGSPSSVTAVQLDVLPPVVQPGANASAAGDAGTAFGASTEPAISGVTLVLQRRTDDGWRKVARSRTGAGGRTTFALPKAGDATRAGGHRVIVEGRPEVQAQAAGDWRLKFSDQFDGSQLGPQWSYRALGVLSAESGRKVSASSKDAVEVRDGTLRLQVKRDPVTDGNFLNGHISTEKSYLFRYGVAAARIKFQRPRGTHGAFWSQSPTYGNPPGDPATAGTEVDIGEYFGDGFGNGGLASYVYHRDKAGENVKDGDVLPNAAKAVGFADSFWKRYHVYSVEWSPDGYVFRIDGRPTFRSDKAVSARTQFLVLSLLSSDWELPQLDRSLLPAEMQVDWVRVWQRPAG
jgi:beta-glucanase (GH16 family)